jgi:PAS domain S-box-containing protein
MPAKVFSRVAYTFRLPGPLAADPTARMLNVLLWVLTGWFGIWGVILLPFHFRDRFWSMQNQIVTDAALIIALVLLRRGRFRAASLTYLGSIWFFATHVMALNGGIRSPVQALYVTLPISAAWLLGYEAAFWTSAACMSCALVFALLELAGVNLPRNIPGTPIGAWVVFGMACLIGALPVAQILRDLRDALTRSRRAEDKSRRTLERLETEIDEHKRTEQALRESEERFRITADTAPVMILARDANQNATFFNKVWLDFTGRSLEQELGTGWTEGVHPGELESHMGDLTAAYAERREYHLQFRLQRADGEYRLLLCHGVPRFELDRNFDGYIASCIDITDLKRSQEETLARQKLESLGVLAGGIAHDFNNLLGSISAQSEVLMEELRDPSSRERVSKIESVAAKAAEIVRQLMVYAGHESEAFDEVDLAALVREMLPLMDVSASKNATFDVHLPDGLPIIRANVTQIRQVLLNLVTNASDALGGMEGVITIALTELHSEEWSGGESLRPLAGHCLRLDISDTGCGMTDQIRTGIFDPFFSTKGAGRGLGLAAVQGIVRGHGGNISVVSTPGRGSRFEIYLPCATELELVPGGRRVLTSMNSAEIFKGTVLMIEDEEMLRQGVSRILRAKGVHVLEAGDGRDAVELFRSHADQIDVALLDVTLTGLSGREVLSRLREIRPPVKVIITSAYGRDQALTMVNAEPSQPYIRKPYRVNELLDLIRETCLNEPGDRSAQQASS